MITVSLRELNQKTAEVMARVERGESLEITRNGRRIATIGPSGPHPLEQLLASGLISVVATKNDLTFEIEENVGGSSGLDAILDDRYGTGRW